MNRPLANRGLGATHGGKASGRLVEARVILRHVLQLCLRERIIGSVLAAEVEVDKTLKFIAVPVKAFPAERHYQTAVVSAQLCRCDLDARRSRYLGSTISPPGEVSSWLVPNGTE